MENRHNIHPSLVNAVSFLDGAHPQRAWRSVTQLIDSPQIFMLRKEFENEIVRDASQGLFALFGTAVHQILDISSHKEAKVRDIVKCLSSLNYMMDKAKNDEFKKDSLFLIKTLREYIQTHLRDKINTNVMTEKTFIQEFDDPFGEGTLDLSGTLDYYNKETAALNDFKVLTTWIRNSAAGFAKFEAQQNIYAKFLRDSGYPVEKIQIVAIYRNFTNAVKFRSDLKAASETVDIRIWSNDEVDEYIYNRMKLHRHAERTGEAACSSEDMWESATTYAIKKAGNKKALKVHTDYEQALADAAVRQQKLMKTIKVPDAISIETRLGERRRCSEYCDVKDFCKQWADYKRELAERKADE